MLYTHDWLRQMLDKLPSAGYLSDVLLSSSARHVFVHEAVRDDTNMFCHKCLFAFG